MADYIRREDALFAIRKAERGGSMTRWKHDGTNTVGTRICRNSGNARR